MSFVESWEQSRWCKSLLGASFILGVVYYRTDANQYQMERESFPDKAIQDLNFSDRTAARGSWAPEGSRAPCQDLRGTTGIHSTLENPSRMLGSICWIFCALSHRPHSDGAGDGEPCLESAWEHFLNADFVLMFKYTQSSSLDFLVPLILLWQG